MSRAPSSENAWNCSWGVNDPELLIYYLTGKNHHIFYESQFYFRKMENFIRFNLLCKIKWAKE